jgi:Tol biopolymer transport system component
MGTKSNSLMAAPWLLIFMIVAPGQTSDRRMPFDSDKPISEPTIFAPGVISTGDYEVCPQFSPDGKTFYFVKSTPDANFWTIVFSRFENGKWNAPQVAPFSGQHSDADEFITHDGKQMFFISKRPLPNATNKELRKLDIWVIDKTAMGWGEPRNLGAPVNSEESEYFPTLTNDGTLYFGSRRAGGKGGADLYRSRFVKGKYQEPENLGDAINTEFDEYEPFIAPDESFLIFMAGGRPDGLGGFDLYISYNRNGQWTKAKNLGAPINSATDELSPRITPDGKYFFWASARSAIDKPKTTSWTIQELSNAYHGPGNGLGDIYCIDISALKIER